MKKTFYQLLLAVLLGLVPVAVVTLAPLGCKQPASRSAYTTIASVAKSVDIAEREYLDGVLAKRYSTNHFPQVQASYDAFQSSLRLALATARNDTNALAPLNLSAEANALLQAIRDAKGAK
jgi:uncharacterized protein with FMN-binding domain